MLPAHARPVSDMKSQPGLFVSSIPGQVKLIGKSGELHWEDYQLKTTLLLIVGTDA